MIQTLFTHRLELIAPVTATDDYGDTTSTWPDSGTVWLGWVSQRSSAENRDNRVAEVGEWNVFLPADCGLTGHYRIRWHDPTFDVDRLFEVVGPPVPAHTPDGPHHIEATLRQVEG